MDVKQILCKRRERPQFIYSYNLMMVFCAFCSAELFYYYHYLSKTNYFEQQNCRVHIQWGGTDQERDRHYICMQ